MDVSSVNYAPATFVSVSGGASSSPACQPSGYGSGYSLTPAQCNGLIDVAAYNPQTTGYGNHISSTPSTATFLLHDLARAMRGEITRVPGSVGGLGAVSFFSAGVFHSGFIEPSVAGSTLVLTSRSQHWVTPHGTSPAPPWTREQALKPTCCYSGSDYPVYPGYSNYFPWEFPPFGTSHGDILDSDITPAGLSVVVLRLAGRASYVDVVKSYTPAQLRTLLAGASVTMDWSCTSRLIGETSLPYQRLEIDGRFSLSGLSVTVNSSLPTFTFPLTWPSGRRGRDVVCDGGGNVSGVTDWGSIGTVSRSSGLTIFDGLA